MKFIANKKLTHNATLRFVMIWMLLLFVIAMGLSLSAKGIEYGFTPQEWTNSVMGSETEFIEPLHFKDLLLTLHTDLFALIILFILIASLFMRTSYSTAFKLSFLSLSLFFLLTYPIALLFSALLGAFSVVLSLSAFIGFHFLMLLTSIHILYLLFKKKI